MADQGTGERTLGRPIRRARRGKGNPTSQGWPMNSASSSEGPGLHCYRGDWWQADGNQETQIAATTCRGRDRERNPSGRPAKASPMWARIGQDRLVVGCRVGCKPRTSG
jgi:hypothetical protein